MSIVDDDQISNNSDNVTLQEVVAARLSRRALIGGAAGAVALTGINALVGAVPARAAAASTKRAPLLGFQGIPVSSADTVVVPPGYTARVLISWGDPVSAGPAFKPDASNTSAEQAQQWGMHNDGLVYFPLRLSREGLIVENSEYTDDVLLFPDGKANWTAEKTQKSLNAHGVNIIHVKRGTGRNRDMWEVVRPSEYARRITGSTPIRIGGPLAANPDDRLKTSADPTGLSVLGTLNNCAMGFTPWGTYLTCEENFNGYFRKNGPQTELERRYGITAAGFGYLWHTTDTRFQVDVEPNEPNRFGWVVEIDPFDPSSTPVKRTALGRIKHEGAWVQEARDGRVVVYSGDDEQFEYIYRFVSNRKWRQAIRAGINPLDDGILYAAKFNADGWGEWLPLTPDNPALAGWSYNDILINTRGAADRAGATPMDRPEWIDTFPRDLTAIATLTNNSQRGVAGTNPRTLQPNPGVDAANPRARNVYGHIVRWTYEDDFTEPTFYWDIFALAGDPDPNNPVPDDGSTIVGDKYGSPDGIYVAPSGRLWIQTDVSGNTINTGAYAGFGNNQMLCADPETKETRRFLVGPNVCEVTGCFVTPDERTMFVGIQHPGEAPTGENDAANPKRYSSWPEGPTGGRPRSSCLVITKDDGGRIGS
ncbi:MAG: PhoX family protein [Ilumatobacteraceae bacterium]